METKNKQLKDRTYIMEKLKVLLEPWLDDTDSSESLNEQSGLLMDLGLDSVAIMQLILGVEKEFTVTIKDYELDSEVFSKMGNLMNLIEDKINETD